MSRRSGRSVGWLVNVIDDHSRLSIGARAMRVFKKPDVVEWFHDAAMNWGSCLLIATPGGVHAVEVDGYRLRHDTIDRNGQLIRALTLDPTRDYQPQK